MSSFQFAQSIFWTEEVPLKMSPSSSGSGWCVRAPACLSDPGGCHKTDPIKGCLARPRELRVTTCALFSALSL